MSLKNKFSNVYFGFTTTLNIITGICALLTYTTAKKGAELTDALFLADISNFIQFSLWRPFATIAFLSLDGLISFLTQFETNFLINFIANSVEQFQSLFDFKNQNQLEEIKAIFGCSLCASLYLSVVSGISQAKHLPSTLMICNINYESKMGRLYRIVSRRASDRLVASLKVRTLLYPLIACIKVFSISVLFYYLYFYFYIIFPFAFDVTYTVIRFPMYLFILVTLVVFFGFLCGIFNSNVTFLSTGLAVLKNIIVCVALPYILLNEFRQVYKLGNKDMACLILDRAKNSHIFIQEIIKSFTDFISAFILVPLTILVSYIASVIASIFILYYLIILSDILGITFDILSTWLM